MHVCECVCMTSMHVYMHVIFPLLSLSSYMCVQYNHTCLVDRECKQQEEQPYPIPGEIRENTDTHQWPAVVWQCFMKGPSVFH